MYSDQVFEVFVAFRRTILDEDAHLRRLRTSAETLGIQVPWSDAELKFDLATLLEQTNFLKSNLRLVITRGQGLGIGVPSDAKPNKIIYCLPASIEDERVYQTGISLQVKRMPYLSRGSQPKVGNYLHAVLGRIDATRAGFDDVLWSNSEGEVTEASTANIFFIGRTGDAVDICTPPAHSGILEGITRNTVLGLLKKASINAVESVVYDDQIFRFDEAFVCSTVRGLVPIAKVGRHKLHTSRDTSIFRQFERLYLTWVETQVGERVDWNTGKSAKRSTTRQ
jgi:branched-chain amino acid aminotransferase